ncbi:hypothetical protein HEK616_65710 [Streptomyces nigrescens]|uniref:Uncharacterized protein n=1 Tax=Streptomyces nigrescens TaxID=1920 RepID=A0ABM8A390_STRNI|nr:hypothetical protein HEK616_65710 [Streptomyces nigrescens]
MNANQQHLLDAYRAARRGETTPPLPGAHTVRTVREIRWWRRLRRAALGTSGAERDAGRGTGRNAAGAGRGTPSAGRGAGVGEWRGREAGVG